MSFRALLVWLAVVVAAAEARGDGPAPVADKPHTDLYGDSLPAGALLRLGSTRLKSDANQMFFTPDGRTLITSNGRTIRRWNAETGKSIGTSSLPRTCWAPSALSPDGTRLAGGDGEGGMAVWDVTSGTCVCHVQSGNCFQAALSPDGAILATYGAHNQIRLWDPRTGKELPSPDGNYEVWELAFSPDGSRLIATTNEAIVCLDAAGKEAWRAEGRMWSLAYAPGGILAVPTVPGKGKNDRIEENDPREVHFINIADGKPSGRKPLPLPKEAGAIRYSPDGGYLAWRTPTKIVVWDLAADKARRTLRFGADAWAGHPFAFAPDGKTLTALVGHTLHRWDLATGKDLYPDVSKRGHAASVDAVAWSADGRTIATRNQTFDPSIRVWDAADGKLLRTLPAPEGQQFGLCWLAFAPDGKRLFSAGGDGAIHCWDLSTEKQVWSGTPQDLGTKGPAPQLDGFHLSADGKRLVAFSVRNGSWGSAEEIVCDAATGKLLQHSAVPMACRSDAYSSDGMWRVSGNGEIYDVKLGSLRRTLKARFTIGNPFSGGAGAFSLDGGLFAASLLEPVDKPKTVDFACRGIQVWETATGKPLTVIPEKGFGRVIFSPDGRTIVVVGDDDIRAWDAVTGEEVYRQAVGDRLLNSYRTPVAFSPDGTRLVVGCSDTTAVIWDVSSARRRAGSARPLTARGRDALWDDLAGDDAAKAYAAIDRLAAQPGDGIALLRDRLRPAVGVPQDKFKRLVAALDADDFEARESAARQLAELEEQLDGPLRAALEGDLTAEQKARIVGILKASAAPSAETLRGLRAVRALAWAGTPEARAVLERLAGGAADAPLTRAARAALDR